MLTDRASALLPTLRREDLTWRTVGTKFEIQMLFVNESDESTEDLELVIEAAPFGAFIPFEPHTRLAVSGFAPRERRIISALVDRAQMDTWQSPIYTRALSQERIELLQREQVTRKCGWIGNLSIHFEGSPEEAVERHVAFHLVTAGVTAGFLVSIGNGEPDSAYTIEVTTSDPDWRPAVDDAGYGLVDLRVSTPPEAGRRANIDILVTRKSDSKVVRVEFDLETIAGLGDSIS